MTDREKLIELIGQVQYLGGLELALADHLLANGATFQKWVPVSERLPAEGELVLIICKNGARFVGYYIRTHYNDEIHWGIKTALNSTRWLNKGRVTHWIPLPQPPQEVSDGQT